MKIRTDILISFAVTLKLFLLASIFAHDVIGLAAGDILIEQPYVSVANTDEGDYALSSHTKVILNSDGKQSVSIRLRAVKKLPSRLDEQDAEALLAFLASPSDTSASVFNLATIKNDLTGVIGRDPRYVNQVAETLIACSSDKEQGLVWQNYCVQYYPYVYEKASGTMRQCLDSAVVLALEDPTIHIAGTALLAMKKLIGQSSFEQKDLMTAARILYSTPNVHNGNKMTAFIILGEQGDPQILVEARSILTKNIDSVALRMSAMSILGKQGSVQDIALLEKFANDQESRLHRAAKLNLKTLQKRLEKESNIP